jgi:hypothetical protein
MTGRAIAARGDSSDKRGIKAATKKKQGGNDGADQDGDPPVDIVSQRPKRQAASEEARLAKLGGTDELDPSLIHEMLRNPEMRKMLGNLQQRHQPSKKAGAKPSKPNGGVGKAPKLTSFKPCIPPSDDEKEEKEEDSDEEYDAHGDLIGCDGGEDGDGDDDDEHSDGEEEGDEKIEGSNESDEEDLEGGGVDGTSLGKHGFRCLAFQLNRKSCLAHGIQA